MVLYDYCILVCVGVLGIVSLFPLYVLLSHLRPTKPFVLLRPL
jgi:hypothetical protein